MATLFAGEARRSPGGAEASRHFDDYWSECDHFRIDDDEDDERPPPEEEQDADWLREVGLDFVLRDDGRCPAEGVPDLGEPGAQAYPDASRDLLRVPYLRTLSREQAAAVQKRLDTVTLRRKKHPPKLDVREVFGRPSSIHEQQSEDGLDGFGGRRRAQWRVAPPRTAALQPAASEPRVPPASAVHPRQPSSSLWKNHRHQYELKATDAIATPDAKGVAVIGYRMKGTVRHIPEPDLMYQDIEEAEELDECPVRSQMDWTLQPGFSESYALEHPDQELPCLLFLAVEPLATFRFAVADDHKEQRVRVNLCLEIVTEMVEILRRALTTTLYAKRWTTSGFSVSTKATYDANTHTRKAQAFLLFRSDGSRRHTGTRRGLLFRTGLSTKPSALFTTARSRRTRTITLALSSFRFPVSRVRTLLEMLIARRKQVVTWSRAVDRVSTKRGVPYWDRTFRSLRVPSVRLRTRWSASSLAAYHLLSGVPESALRGRGALRKNHAILPAHSFSTTRSRVLWKECQRARENNHPNSPLVAWFMRAHWNIPSQLLSQIRMAYRMELDKKHLKENKKKKRKERSSWFAGRDAGDVAPDVVRVRVDHDSHQAADATHPVKLSDATTAGSVVGEVFLAMHFEARKKDIVNAGRPSSDHSRTGAHFDDTVATFLQHHWLYEVGGYIGWRRLEHATNVAAVCRENPLADWAVRCHH
ncbi:unnamed protein product [Ixodes hexagonus]